jgi:hypothetical protein
MWKKNPWLSRLMFAELPALQPGLGVLPPGRYMGNSQPHVGEGNLHIILYEILYVYIYTVIKY